MQNEHSLDWLMELLQNAKTEGTDEAKKNAVSSVSASLLESLLHDSVSADSSSELELLGTGIAASPGAASGILCFSSDAVLDATDRGEKAILVCNETTPADEIGMRMAEGIVTVRGGMASHAAVVARGWGIPAVVGLADLEISAESMTIGGTHLEYGTHISMDGTTGNVFAGKVQLQKSSDELAEIQTLLELSLIHI